MNSNQRVFKFRAWDLRRPHMIDDTKTIANIISKIISGYSMNYGSYFSRVTDSKKKESQEYILMQYTGLTDRNGKEIYEGDLMTWDDCHSRDGNPFIIEFSTNLSGGQYGGGEDFFAGFSFPSVAEMGIVVGNIYENADLYKLDE